MPRIAVAWDTVAPGRQWHEVEGTLCFVDISGFTNLSERLAARGRIGAEELTQILDRVFSAMLRTAYEYGGSLMKFGGDALLLLFTGDDHAMRAASAVVAMQATLRATSAESTSAGKVRLRMSVGVHSGTIQLFCVGTSHRELMITGPAGTLTTTMEHTADAGEIVVSDATRALLPKGAAPVEKAPGWRLKWRKPPMEPTGVGERNDLGLPNVDLWLPSALRSYLTATDPEPEHRVATVGFIRFCGVDELIRHEGPAAVADGLQEMVDVIQAAADAEDVTFLASDINEDGGKVILVAGAPRVQEDDEGRMMRAARRIVDADTRFDLHVGVNRGHVFAGEVGTEYRSTYTVMGDTVNVAARLCAAAWAGRILATPDVLERSHTMFATEPLEPLPVKGKSEPLVVYEVGEELGFRADETRTDLPFVGRANELETILGVLDATGEEQRAVTSIVGDTGTGKSRIVDEALRLRPDLQTVEVRAEPYGAANPYRPLRDPLRNVLGIERGAQAAMIASLEAKLRGVDKALVPLLPLLGDVMHIDVPETPETTAIEPRFRGDRLADVLIAVLETVLTDPTVFVIEDGHWMDEASSHVLGRLAGATSTHPWAVLSTRRAGESGFETDEATTIALEPLTTDAARELVIAATSAAPLRPHEVEAIVSRVGGNPLFIEETIKAVRQSGGVTELSDSLAAVVGTRIDALPPLARRILRYCSVLGQSFRITAMQALLTEDDLTLDSATRRELAGFLERDGPGRLRFRHAMTRDVAYAGLSFDRRRQLHLRAAAAAEEAASGHVDDIADLLAMHYSLGANHEKAWHFARIAGDNAKDAYANVEAAANYERALESAKRLETISDDERAAVWVNLGEVREPLGLFDGALDAYKRASRLLDKNPRRRAHVQYKRASLRDRSGAYSMALRNAAAGYRILDGDTSNEAARIKARLAMRRASIRQAQGRPRDAMRLAEQAADEARRAGEKHAEAAASMIIHTSHLITGEPGGTKHGERALELFSELGELEEVAGVTNNLGAEAYFTGRWDEALDYYRRGRDAALRAGDLMYAALIGSNIGELLVSQGRLDEAEPILRDASRIQRASGWIEGADAAERSLGRLLIQRQDYEEAASLLQQVRDDYVSMGRRGYAVETGFYLAQSLIGAERLTEASALVDAITESGLEGHVALHALVRSELAAALGRFEEARDFARTGIDFSTERNLEYERALLIVALVNAMRGLEREVDPALIGDAEAALERFGIEHGGL